MNKLTYKNIVDKNMKIKDKLKRAIMAFVGGGSIAIIGQLIYDFYTLVIKTSAKDGITLMLVTIILVTSFLTGLGVFDKIATNFGAGSFIPISGFSNALTSSALESKSEGLIYGIGHAIYSVSDPRANIFRSYVKSLVFMVISCFFL